MGVHKQIADRMPIRILEAQRRPCQGGQGLRAVSETLKRSAFSQYAHAHNDVPDDDEQRSDPHNNDETDT